MKKIASFLLQVLVAFTAAAQYTVNDSVVLQPGISQMVFYKLSDGTKNVVTANDWHIALSVRATQFPNSPLGGTTIRLNEAYGVKCFFAPNADVSQFSNNLDTTGFNSWLQLHDSDTKLDNGALNSIRSTNLYDFGWGSYNPSSHNVVGDSIFLFQLPNGSLKKFKVNQLVFDTLFQLTIANTDGSGEQVVQINKPDYAGKAFVYLNLETGAVMDKEPLMSNWDLLFLKYTASDVQPGAYYPTTGVWQKPDVTVAELSGVNTATNDYSGGTFSNSMNIIGWDWKLFNQSTSQYEIQDSLLYFVRSGSATYKLVFTGFGGNATGVINFSKTDYNLNGINSPEQSSAFVKVYPNPTNNVLNIVSLDEKEISSLQLFDVRGALLQTISGIGIGKTVDVSDLQPGIYYLTARSDEGVHRMPFIISR